MKKRIEEVCRKAIEKFGESNQIDMALEEMAELSVALNHYNRGRATKEDVITEIADVFITVSQLGLIFGVDEVSREMGRKIDRLEERIHKGQTKEYYGN